MTPLKLIFGKDTNLVFDTRFQTLLIANMSAPLGTALVSPLLGSLLVPLSVSEARVGLIMTAFTAPSMVLTPLAGIISDRYGRKPVLLIGIFLFGVAGTAISVATDFSTVVGFRFLQGVGYAGITPILVTSIGDLYSGSSEATAQGLRFTSSGLIQTIFPVIAAVLVTISWQYPFLLYASALPVCLVIYLWFDEPTEGVASGALIHPADRTDKPNRLREFAQIFFTRRIIAVIIARGTPPFVYFGFLTYNSIIVRSMGGTPTDAGILVAIASVTYAGSASQAGRVTSFFDTRTTPLILMNMAMGVGFTIIAIAPSLFVIGIGVVSLGFGFGVSMSLYRSFLTSMVTESFRGGIISIGESTGRAAITITPIVMGSILAIARPVLGFDGAIRLMVFLAGIIPSLLGIACMIVVKRSPDPTVHS